MPARLFACFLLMAACDCGGDDSPTDGGGDASADASADAARDGATDVGADGARDSAIDTGDDAACRPTGLACGAPSDCCSNVCTGGLCAEPPMCDRVGTACTSPTDCCSGACNTPGGGPCAGGGDCTCAPSPACLAGGSTCSADAECCNNFCDRPGGAAEGTCASLGACGTAGEPCSSPGLSGSCCSTVCLDTDGTGPRCQFLGGCRVQDELCTSDGECCSNACEVDATTADGREIRRCANADSCLPVGEVCGEGGASSNCCPNGGGDTGCEPTGTGFRRCFGGTGDCTLPGDTCVSVDECCVDAYPDITCAEGRDGMDRCCLPEGAECAFGDVCCGGICTPDSEGVLRCGSMCVADGNACTSDADCCGCACISDGAGGQVCTSDEAECGPCTGPSLGELCDPAGEPCCNGPTVICNDSTEFSTCILAP